MRGFDEGRLGVAAMSLGISQGALDAATRYAGERQQFGKEIAAYQGVQFLVADMAIGVLYRRGRWSTTRCVPSPAGFRRLTVSGDRQDLRLDVAMDVTSSARPGTRGAGYVSDFPVEMLMRDAKINQIYEGTNQILRMVIARTYFGDLARRPENSWGCRWRKRSRTAVKDGYSSRSPRRWPS